MFRVNAWIFIASIWIAFIFFTSTSLASQLAEEAFGNVANILLNKPSMQKSSYALLHILADKGFHVSMFCVLAILLWLAIVEAPRKPWLIVACGAVVGSLSELLQRLFPDRDPALRDVFINIGGTALGTAICLAIAKIRKRPSTAIPESR